MNIRRFRLTVVADVVTIAVLVAAATVIAIRYTSDVADLIAADRSVSLSPVTTLDLEGISFKGDSRAPVVVIEFSDFVCPFCRRHAREVAPDLERRFIATGQVQYGFAFNPVSRNVLRRLSATGALCASRQGLFWEAHDRLFAARFSTEEQLDAVWSSVNLDQDQQQRCMAEASAAETIKRHRATARRLGLEGTPGFVFGTRDANGRITWRKSVSGAHSRETFRQLVQELLGARG